VRLLPDTRILLWTAAESWRLSALARASVGEPDNELTFSSISLWEVAIKAGRGRAGFRVDASSLPRSLVDNGYAELPMLGANAAALPSLPRIHKDPFDRMLVAQAIVEGLTLLMSDPTVAKYPGSIRLV